MMTLKQTSQFKKDLKRIQNNPSKVQHLEDVLHPFIKERCVAQLFVAPHIFFSFLSTHRLEVSRCAIFFISYL